MKIKQFGTIGEQDGKLYFHNFVWDNEGENYSSVEEAWPEMAQEIINRVRDQGNEFYAAHRLRELERKLNDLTEEIRILKEDNII